MLSRVQYEEYTGLVDANNQTPIQAITAQDKDFYLVTAKHALDALHLAHQEYNESIESINNRAGIMLSVIVTAFAVLVFRFDQVQLKPFGNSGSVALVLQGISFLLIGVGVFSNLKAIVSSFVNGPFNVSALSNESEIQILEIDFLYRQIKNFADGAESRAKTMKRKRFWFNLGLWIAVAGIFLNIIIQLISSLLQINLTFH